MPNPLEVAQHAVAHRGHRSLAAIHDEAHEALQMWPELGIASVAATAQPMRELERGWVAMSRVCVDDHAANIQVSCNAAI